jgi:hypothetical protein
MTSASRCSSATTVDSRALFRAFVAGTAIAVAPAIVCGRPAAAYGQRINPTAKAVAGYQEAIQKYVELHRKLAKTLAPLPTDATPQAIDQRQRDLARLIQEARRGAKQGDIFDAEVRPVLRKLLRGLFTGPDGKKLRASVMEENPGPAVKLEINGRYPDSIPLSSVPPQVLKELPALPNELEYRFIEDKLILLDTGAHIIVDYLTGAVPR